MYQVIIADDEAKIRSGLANLFPWNQLGFEIAAVCSKWKRGLGFRHGKSSRSGSLRYTDAHYGWSGAVPVASAKKARKNGIFQRLSGF